jgi:hypothetical protein
MIDFASARDIDVTYVAFDELGTRIQIAEGVLDGTGTDVARQCGDYIDRMGWKVVLCQIDPLARGDKYRDDNSQSTFDKIENEFIRQNRPFQVEIGSKNKDEGIRVWNTNIKTRSGKANFFIFESCKKSIGQCYRWRNDPKTGKPIKKDDDQPENLYRTYLFEISDYDYSDRRQIKDEKTQSSFKKWG